MDNVDLPHGTPQPLDDSLTWLEKSPVCTKILDLDFNLHYMSSAGVCALQIDNITAHYGSKFPFSFYSSESQEHIRKHLEKAVETRSVVEYEGPVLDTRGEELWFQSTVVPIGDSEGEFEYLMVISIEATERRLLELELRKSQALFGQAEQMGKLGHWEWDVPSDRLTTYSEQYAAIFGLTLEGAKLSGSDFDADVERYIHPDDRARYLRVTEEAYERKKPWDIEYQIITGDRRSVYVHEKGEPLLDKDGRLIKTFGTLQDITQRKQVEEQLSYQANHDSLTGLINRRAFENRAGQLLSTIKQDKTEHAMCFMDLDQFKIVNDTCGHTAGDELLHQLGYILKKTVRRGDTLARLGGDEFGLLMEHCSIEDAHRVVESIISAISDYQFSWEGNVFKVTVSIGLVLINETTGNVSTLLKDADAACYVAKEKGRNRLHVHHAEDAEVAKRHGEMQWVTRVNRAFEEGRFTLYAQPIESLGNPDSRHYELLLRMIDENKEIIAPGAFLPAAERYNIITRLDGWVIDRTFKYLHDYPSLVEKMDFLSVNLSGPSLADASFREFVVLKLEEYKVDASKICFEITETAAIANMSKAVSFISNLKALGCRFALDDFGSGLSSFAYLKNLPVEYLKIDGMFVRDIVDDPIDHAMVKSINEIGQLMGMETIAEFVENDAIKQKLQEIGVNYVQGHGIGRPQPFEELIEAWAAGSGDEKQVAS
jgi:diguanylate cyclase (GGDEF)-like protein/PAS domain S-box-containing protein